MKTHSSTHLAKFASKTEQTLLLLREELKSRRLMHSLRNTAFANTPFEPHLNELILQHLGLDMSDETFYRYEAVMNKHVHLDSGVREVYEEVVTLVGIGH